VADVIYRIGLYESLTVIPVAVFAPGTYTFRLGTPAGNSLLSTVFMKSVSGSVTFQYLDSGPGSGVLPGELIDLGSHKTFTSGPESERIIITRISNKPFIKVTVAGGAAEFGLHISIVSDFPSEAPFLEGDAVDLARDKGQPIVLYDETAGTWNLMRGVGGSLSAVVDEPGTPKLFAFSGVSGGTQNMFTLSPPVGKVWRLLQLVVTCRAETSVKAHDNAALIGSLRTGAAAPNAKFNWPPYTITTALTVDVSQSSGPQVDLEGFVFLTEI
jgi:hypothetical protein